MGDLKWKIFIYLDLVRIAGLQRPTVMVHCLWRCEKVDHSRLYYGERYLEIAGILGVNLIQKMWRPKSLDA